MSKSFCPHDKAKWTTEITTQSRQQVENVQDLQRTHQNHYRNIYLSIHGKDYQQTRVA